MSKQDQIQIHAFIEVKISCRQEEAEMLLAGKLPLSDLIGKGCVAFGNSGYIPCHETDKLSGLFAETDEIIGELRETGSDLLIAQYNLGGKTIGIG